MDNNLDIKSVLDNISRINLFIEENNGKAEKGKDYLNFSSIDSTIFDQYLFKILMDSSPDLIYFKDLKSRFIKVNKAYIKKMNAISEDEILWKTDFDFFDSEHALDARKDELFIIETGNPIINKVEKEILSSGQIAWVSTTKLPLNNTENEIIGTFGVSRDVTANREIQEQLRLSEERLRYLISSTSAVIYNLRVSGDSFIPVWIGENINQFGYTPNEVLKPGLWAEIVHPDDLEYVSSIIKKLFNNDKQIAEYRIRHKEGHYIWIRDEMVLVRDSKDNPLEIFGSWLNISERMKMEEALLSSEEQLSVAMKIANLAHWEYDVLKDEFVFNDQFYSIFRTTVEKEGGYTMSSKRYAESFVHPDDLQMVGEEIQKSVLTKDPNFSSQLEHRIIYADGEMGYVSIRYFIIKDENGKTIKTYGVNQDITSRKKVEEALRASEYFLRKSQSVARIGSYKFDVKSSMWESSEVLDEILGINASYNKNVNGIFKLVHPSQHRELFIFIGRNEILKQKRFEKEYQIIKNNDKQERWIQVIGNLEFDKEGKPVTVIGTIQDVTDRILHEKEKQDLEKQLKLRNNELEKMLSDMKLMQGSLVQAEKMASLGQLSAGIAHEINNPLAFVSSNVNRLKEYFQDTKELLQKWQSLKPFISDQNDIRANINEIEEFTKEIDLEFILEDFDKMMASIKEGTLRIKNIVEGMRGFARISNSSSTEADINKAIDDTLTIVWNEIKYKASIEKEYGEIPSVECNIGEIKQVLVNLLVNASHAIEDKGIIKIKTYSYKESVYVKIQDSGSGILEENIKKIFDPFFTTKPVGKGTGLGLWISSSIIEKHGGTISVESEIGKGSTFTIKLPTTSATNTK